MSSLDHGYIDLHHHLIPDFFRAALEAHAPNIGGGEGLSGLHLPSWSPSAAISLMDEASIAVGVASLSFGVHFGDDAQAAALARRSNEFLAELVRDRPDRFGGFAVLPLPAVSASLKELTYALDELNLDGIVLSTNYGGVYLGDPRFDAVFAELEHRGTVVFVHPTGSPDPSAHDLGLPDFLIDFVADTTRAIAKLHYSNTFVRTPTVKYIFAHAGGTIPYLTSRFTLLDRLAAMPGHQERPPATEMFHHLYYDTAIAFTQPVVQLVQQVAGTDQLVYGSDYPFTPGFPQESTRSLTSADYLSTEQRAAIARYNAIALLPRLNR